MKQPLNNRWSFIAVVSAFGTALAVGAAAAPVQPVDTAGQPAPVRLENIQPFTHQASIPLTANPGTIRFEKVKATKVPTQIKYTTEASLCKTLTEPGGSMYCPDKQARAYVDAYDVAYSFAGPADEFGNTRSAFHVYLRPEELTPVLKEAIAAKKLNRGKLSEYFHIGYSQEPARRVVVDEAKSSFCPGSFAEEGWIHNDARCQDRISYTTVTAPADYLTVRVEAIAIPELQAAIQSGK